MYTDPGRCLGTCPAPEYSLQDMYPQRADSKRFRPMSGWLVISGLFMALCGLPVFAGAAVTTFVAEDYAFTGPEQLESGWQRVRLINRGRDVHQVQFLALPPEKTLADVERALAARSPSLPNWLRRHGGVNSVAPGDEASVGIQLDPGDYVLLCGIPDVAGRPHAMRGMLRVLRVVEAAPQGEFLLRPDATLRLNDFAFVLSGPLQAGSRTVHLVNDGRQAHELVLIRLTGGASAQEFIARYRPGGLPNSAGREAGGVTGLDPGRQASAHLKLVPGRYGLLCFLADPVTGSPHFSRGMWMDIEVKPELPSAEGP
jgi:uncharacterized cupredoxin-like copper-binding protein